MPDELKREEVIERVRRESYLNSFEADGYVMAMIHAGVPLSEIGTGEKE